MKEIILETVLEAKSVQRSEDGRMRFVGLAFRDNTLSANGNLFTEKCVDETALRTSAWIAAGNVSTSYATHGQAIGGAFSLPTHKPLGKVTRFWREGTDLLYEATISPTEEGKDMMTLIEDGVVVHTSVRSHMYEGEEVKVSIDDEEREVFRLDWLIINGVDFCDQPGVAGAGIIKVLESTPTYITEDTMDITKLTLEELQAERPDLLQPLLDQVSTLQAGIAEKDALIESAEAKVAEDVSAAATKLDALSAAVDETQAELALWQEMATPLMQAMVALRKEAPDKDRADIMKEAVQSLVRDADGGSFGQSYEPENDKMYISESVSQEMESLIENTELFA